MHCRRAVGGRCYVCTATEMAENGYVWVGELVGWD